MTAPPFKALKIGPDGWAHGVQIGRWLVDRPDTVLDPKADPAASTEIEEVVTAEDCDAMIRAYEAAGRPLLPVDADHSTELGGSTAAYFWVSGMRRCEDGIEILLEPTDLGQAGVIEGRRWRYLSPVFPWHGFAYEDEARLIGHPRVVTNWGLTNFPRMRQIRPVVNAAAPAAAANQETPTRTKKGTMDYKTLLCAILGLDAEAATDEDIQAAADAARASAAANSATEAMDEAELPADPAVRDPLAELWKEDPEAGAAAVAAAGAALNAQKAAAAKNAAKPPARPARALHTERRAPQPPAGAGSFRDKAAAVNAAVAANPGITRSQAYSIAKRSNPELF